MSPRNTLLLLGVVAAAAVSLWWFELRGAEERAQAEAASRRVFTGVEAAGIDWIELRTQGEGAEPGGVARLERDPEGGWRLVEPLAFPADTMAADGIASALAELDSERIFEEPEPLEVYGLEGPARVRFGTDAGSFGLRVGDATPVGGNTYVAPEEGGAVHAVATWRTNPLRKSLEELRDARVLDFDRSAVTAIEARWPGDGVRVERSEEGWRLVEPLETEADAETAEGLLADLAFLRAEGFVDAPASDAELGLDEPAYVVELFRDEGEEPLRLVVGGRSDGETRAARGRDGHLYRIPAARVEDLPGTRAAWRFKELARFDSAAAQALEIVLRSAEGDETLRIEGERGEAGWTTQPQGMAPGKAGALVTELSSLEAADVAAESMGREERAALGLAPPRVRLRVLGEAEDESAEPPVLADVSLGVLDPEQGIAARRADREEIFWLEPRVAESLPASLEAWRNRFASREGEGAQDAQEAAESEEGTAEPEGQAPGD